MIKKLFKFNIIRIIGLILGGVVASLISANIFRLYLIVTGVNLIFMTLVLASSKIKK